MPAHNESEYASTFDGTSPLKAALSLGYVLTDNPYGAASPMAIGPRELFVPEIGVGRLVESPADIDTALRTFLGFHGVLAPETALSSGYDFLTDGAEAVATELDGGLFDSAVDPLINDAWTRDELRDAWIGTSAATSADVASVNAHFDHYRALPADQDATGQAHRSRSSSTTSRGAGRRLARRVDRVQHGLPHGLVGVGRLRRRQRRRRLGPDAQRRRGAIVAGNTGYGYGDDTVVGATEELMRQFARRLDGTMTVGNRWPSPSSSTSPTSAVERQPVRREGRQPGRVLRPADVPHRRRRPAGAARRPADGRSTRSPGSTRCRHDRHADRTRRAHCSQPGHADAGGALLRRQRGDPGDLIPAGPATNDRATSRKPAARPWSAGHRP